MVLKHGLRVLAVYCLVIRHLPLKFKALLFDDAANDVVTGLDAWLLWYVCEMIEQGSEVDPATARLENLVNHLNKVDDVMCTVDEKTRDNNIECSTKSMTSCAQSMKKHVTTTSNVLW